MAATAMVPAQDRPQAALALEQVLVNGDLGKLTAEQRLDYYARMCQSLGLNPLTRPFEYLVLKGKTVLYARKDATEQLRKLHGISIERPEVIYSEDLVIVSVTARDGSGRSDSDIGAVPIAGLKGEDRANAVMKALTKSKRRVTLSICGLGMLDETEVESIPGAVHVEEQSGNLRQLPERQPDSRSPAPQYSDMAALRSELAGWYERYPDRKAQVEAFMTERSATWSVDGLRSEVEKMRQRAADEEAQRQAAAQEAAVTDMSPADRLAATLEIAAKTVAALSSKKGGPNAGDYEGIRVLLRELHAVDPLPDDTPPEQIPPRLLLDALRTRLAVADAGGGEEGARAVRQEIDDAIPF